jgi:hypothetical protein
LTSPSAGIGTLPVIGRICMTLPSITMSCISVRIATLARTLISSAGAGPPWMVK